MTVSLSTTICCVMIRPPTPGHSLAPSPDYYFAAPAVYFNGKIYIFGGYDETFQPTNTTRIYDIATHMWTTGAPMPAALGGMAPDFGMESFT